MWKNEQRCRKLFRSCLISLKRKGAEGVLGKWAKWVFENKFDAAKRRRFRSWPVDLSSRSPGWSTFNSEGCLLKQLDEPTKISILRCYSFSSTPHPVVPLWWMKRPAEWNRTLPSLFLSTWIRHQSFHSKKPISSQLPLWISPFKTKKTNKTHMNCCSNAAIFLVLVFLCAVLWPQNHFQHTDIQFSGCNSGAPGISNCVPVWNHRNDLVSKERRGKMFCTGSICSQGKWQCFTEA